MASNSHDMLHPPRETAIEMILLHHAFRRCYERLPRRLGGLLGEDELDFADSFLRRH